MKEKYLRIGSSKVKLSKYKGYESRLWLALANGPSTIVNVESYYQKFTFDKLLMYYSIKGINLNKVTFEENLDLKTESGKYNVLARILADDSRIPVRFSIFSGKSKADKLFSVKE